MNDNTQPEVLSITEQNTIGVATLNMDGIYTSANNDYTRIIECDLNELIGHSNHSSLDIPLRQLLNSNSNKNSISQVKYYTAKSGNFKLLSLTTTKVKGNNNSDPHIVSVIQDITQQKQNNDSDMLASVAFKHSGDGILITDGNDTIIRVNPAFTKLSGYSENEIIGRKPFLLRSGEHNQTFYNQIWKTLQLEGLWQGEVCYRNKTGGLFYVWETISAVADDEGQFSHYISILSDISIIKKRQQALDDLANYDSLTQLPNRHYFEANLTQATEMSKRRNDKVALLFIDLNKFKPINDIYGHRAGDTVLSEIAKRLTKCVRHEDTAARLGGDEFVILMPRIDRRQLVKALAERIFRAIEKPITINDKRQVKISASIGISIFPDDLELNREQYKHFNLSQESEIMELADLAMYKAKSSEQPYCFFDQMQDLSTASLPDRKDSMQDESTLNNEQVMFSHTKTA